MSNSKIDSDISAPPAHTLRLEDAAIIRGEQLILQNMTLQLKAGARLWLRGDNGAGKSSLLRALAGFIPLAKGTLSLGKRDYQFADDPELPIQFLGHDNGLNPVLTGRQNLQHAAALLSAGNRGSDNSDILGEDRFNVASFADRAVRTLSAGQRQRIALTRLCFSQSGALWLLDEPETGLDADNRKQLYDVIDTHCKAGGRVIMATHRTPDPLDDWGVFECIRAVK